jgi:hypothetical protein
MWKSRTLTGLSVILKKLPDHALVLSESAACCKRYENQGRRIGTLFIKAHELWDIFGVNVALILKNNTRHCS